MIHVIILVLAVVQEVAPVVQVAAKEDVLADALDALDVLEAVALSAVVDVMVLVKVAAQVAHGHVEKVAVVEYNGIKEQIK